MIKKSLKRKNTGNRSLTPNSFSDKKNNYIEEEEFLEKSRFFFHKQIPKETKQLINPNISSFPLQTPREEKPSVKTNAWNDIRFQNFYKFVNKKRDSQTILDEFFINPELNFFNNELDNNISYLSDTVDCSTLNLSSAKPKKINLKRDKKKRISTKKFTLNFTDEFHKKVKIFGLVNDKKFVFLGNLANLKPLLVIDFDIINPDLFANSKLKSELKLVISVIEMNYRVLLGFQCERSYIDFLNLFRYNKSNFTENLIVDFKTEKNFLKKNFISEDDFLHTVNSGDLLLFR